LIVNNTCFYIAFVLLLQPMHAATQNSDMSQEAPKRRGLKPGQVHSGSFKKGDDPRRPCGMATIDGIKFADMARQLGPAVMEWWDQVWRDERHPVPVRLRASELIVERGYGKAPLNIDVNVNRPLNTLSREELMAIAGAQPQLTDERDDDDDDVIEASFTTVSTTETEQ
jgi:hypothetical protein